MGRKNKHANNPFLSCADSWSIFVKNGLLQTQTPLSTMRIILLVLILSGLIFKQSPAQIVINEGSNKNAASLLDEDGEYEDWIELYNAGATAIDLTGYRLSDNANESEQWIFPSYLLQPGQYLVVFCSSKNRFASTPAVTFHTSNAFTPQTGWNNHIAQQGFEWDGVGTVFPTLCSIPAPTGRGDTRPIRYSIKQLPTTRHHFRRSLMVVTMHAEPNTVRCRTCALCFE